MNNDFYKSKFTISGDIDDIDIRCTLMNDIGGLMRKDEHFLPRVSSYDKYLAE